MALDSFATHSRVESCAVHSWSTIAIVLTTRSGSGRARSIDNSPFFKSAAKHLHSVRQHEGALELARRDAAVEILPGLVVLLPPADEELVLLDRHVELVAGEARDRQGDAQALWPAVLAGDPLDIVGRIAVCSPWRRDRAHARSRRSRAGRDLKAKERATWSQSPVIATLRGPFGASTGQGAADGLTLSGLGIIWGGGLRVQECRELRGPPRGRQKP